MSLLEVLDVQISKELIQKIEEALSNGKDVRWVIYDYINNSPYRGLILKSIRDNLPFLYFLRDKKHLIFRNYDTIINYLIKIGERSGKRE